MTEQAKNEAVVAGARAYFTALATGGARSPFAASYLAEAEKVRELLPRQDLRRSELRWERVEVVRACGREAVVDLSVWHDVALAARGRIYELSDWFGGPCLLWLARDGWKVVAYTRGGKTRWGRTVRRSTLDADFTQPKRAGVHEGDLRIEPLHVMLQWDRTRLSLRVANEASQPVRLKGAAVNLPTKLRFRRLWLDEQPVLEPGEAAVIEPYGRRTYPPTTTHLEITLGRWDENGTQLKSGGTVIELGPPGRDVLRAHGWEGPFDV